jgi:LPS-assembly protein
LCDFSIRATGDNSKKFMRFFVARWLAGAMIVLAPAGVCAQALGLKLKLQRTWVGPPPSATPVPTFIFADQIEGAPGKETRAEGNAELRKANTSVEADSMKYFEESEEVEAVGHVRIERAGDVITGPSLKYRMTDSTGTFERPEFTLAPRPRTGVTPVEAHGNASAAEFLGEDRFKIRDAFFTTCKPDKADWYLQAREIDLDYTRQVGTAHGGRVVFKGVTIIPAPFLDFSLNNERKSGFLPPHIGTTGKSGAEFSAPYYLNLAPNYDATLTPRYMTKRGLQIAGEGRYLQPFYNGEYRGEILPNDRARDQTRSAQTFVHNYRDGPLGAGLNLNKVSDDFYFQDLSSRINITSQVNLMRDGYVSYGGAWAGTGNYGITGRVQSFQTLQTDPQNPVPIPYARRPQLSLGAARQDLAGFDFGMSGEYVNFACPNICNAPATNPTGVVGSRAIVYPAFTMPKTGTASFLTPKLGLHVTQYELNRQDPATPASINRTLPIASVDSGLIFERDTQWRGQSFVQTLEPRAYYVYIPFRDQNQIPIFDTAVADLNSAQIFSENAFAGGDRINDANQITLGLTSRMLASSTGQEAFRATFAAILLPGPARDADPDRHPAHLSQLRLSRLDLGARGGELDPGGRGPVQPARRADRAPHRGDPLPARAAADAQLELPLPARPARPDRHFVPVAARGRLVWGRTFQLLDSRPEDRRRPGGDRIQCRLLDLARRGPALRPDRWAVDEHAVSPARA